MDVDQFHTLATYYYVLDAAADASDEVDNFDLDSDDAKSIKEFARLNERCDTHQRELIQFILDNHEQILAGLEEAGTR